MSFSRMALVAAGAIAASAAVSHAALAGNAVVSGTPIGGGMYHYTVTLNNTGTTAVGTLWFAWVPGGNFMATVPTNITSPSGWSAQVVGGVGASSILWQAGSAGTRLGVGGTLTTFGFDSASTPAQLAGMASSSPSNFVTTSFLYSGAAFSDGGFRFTASVVPAPSTLAFASLSLVALSRRRTRRSV